MFGFGLFGALGMMAQSPFVGSLPPTEGSGDYYLYQVESGKSQIGLEPQYKLRW